MHLPVFLEYEFAELLMNGQRQIRPRPRSRPQCAEQLNLLNRVL